MSNNNSVSGCVTEKKGRYYVVVSYYENGRRVQKTKSTGISVTSHKKREALRIMDLLVQEKKKELEKLEQDRSKHSFADCLEKWIDYKCPNLQCTSAWAYKNRGKTIIEYFREKNLMIEDIQPKDLLAYYGWALEHGRRNVYEGMSTGLSRRTVRDHASLIKTFLNDAVVQGVITTNPADKVHVPKVKESNVKEVVYMDTEQSKAFLDYLKTEPLFEKLYYMTKVSLRYGLRRSELLGLRWSVINFNKDEIEVNHTIVRGEQGTVYRDNVKTKSSHRYLPLKGNIKKDLLDIKESQKELGIYSEDGYVFKWDNGNPYDPDYITKLYKKAFTRCGIVPKGMTVHKLRHSCCAILTENGWSLDQIHNWLGHSDISTTANIYNHVSKKWKNKHGMMADEIFE